MSYKCNVLDKKKTILFESEGYFRDKIRKRSSYFEDEYWPIPINGCTQKFLDEHGISFEEYIEMNKNNSYCWNCLNCENCINCSNCTDCKNCEKCEDCTDCKDCTNCKKYEKHYLEINSKLLSI